MDVVGRLEHTGCEVQVEQDGNGQRFTAADSAIEVEQHQLGQRERHVNEVHVADDIEIAVQDVRSVDVVPYYGQ